MPGHDCAKHLRTGRMMPDNDERDPLDRWLDQQVRPLPPPPGTFDMISRRARRRKTRKLAVTVVSAAAVAAAVAFVVPGVTALHLITPRESGNPVAASGTKPSVGGGAGQRYGTSGLSGSGTAAATGSPTESATAPGASSGAGPVQGPVPAGFAPTSVTFVSSTRAWVIGQAGTPGKCYNGSICTSVAWTSDDGATWHGEHAPVTGAPSGPDGVSGIRFLDGVNGWAFGPELWVTHDSGSTWRQVGTGGLRVTDLETAGNRAYALFAKCSGTSPSGFAADCTSYTLMTSLATSNTWTPVDAATSNLSAAGSPAAAMIQLTGSNGYLIAPNGALYSGPLGGTWQVVGTAPCGAANPAASGLPRQGMIASESPQTVAVACGSGTAGTASPWVSVSTDGGATWSDYSASAWSGLSVPQDSMLSLAAAPNGALLLSTSNGIYLRPAGSSRWQAAAPASTVSSGLPAGGFSYVGMTSDTQGVALPANTSLHEIWLTADGGLTWTPSPIAG